MQSYFTLWIPTALFFWNVPYLFYNLPLIPCQFSLAHLHWIFSFLFHWHIPFVIIPSYLNIGRTVLDMQSNSFNHFQVRQSKEFSAKFWIFPLKLRDFFFGLVIYQLSLALNMVECSAEMPWGAKMLSENQKCSPVETTFAFPWVKSKMQELLCSFFGPHLYANRDLQTDEYFFPFAG